MKKIVLNNGVEMPVFGLGTWDLRGRQCVSVAAEALDMGYRLIDTATMYGNEKEVGEGLRESSVERDEVFVTTKIYRPDNSYKGAARSILRSLSEMKLDYLDLVLIHEPYRESPEMYRAMKEALERGMVRVIGVSNFNARFYLEFIKDCGVIPAVNQVESHVYFPQLGLQRTLAEHGTVMQAWAPFTEGMRPIFADPVLNEIGAAHGRTAAQIALRFLVQNGIPVAPKSSRTERLRENMDIFDFELTEEEMKKIEALDEGATLFGWY